MKKHSKKFLEVVKKVEKDKLYTIEEATKLLKETSITKFDGTVEIAMKLNLDTKKNDQQIRGAFILPKGTGKTKKVLVLAKGEQAKIANECEADYVGDVDMITKIEKENFFDFDIIIATPEMMPLLGKLGKILGPKGLMPNPKTGTVTTDVKTAIEAVKKGRIEYKTDAFGNLQAVVGKVSFKEEDLNENINAFIDIITKSKPNSVKGTFIKGIAISSTMSPGIKIDLNSLTNNI